MSVRVVRQRDLHRVPWKNGGGTTCEVAGWPPGAGLDGFDWRLSMADVGTAGPFSIFAGVDRTLVLIEGRGIELIVEGVSHHLDGASPMLRFAGEAVTTARLVDGPIRDLNVMTRRGRFAHEVTALPPGVAGPWWAKDDTVACVALGGPTQVDIGSEGHVLDRFDALVGTLVPAPVRADGPTLWIRFRETGSPPVR